MVSHSDLQRQVLMLDDTFEFIMLRDFHATKAEFIDRVFKFGGVAVIRRRCCHPNLCIYNFLSLCLCVCICMCVYKSMEEEASLAATWLPRG
ncbi:hypothetical protein LguiB_011959 [Lonicera macranthoides]